MGFWGCPVLQVSLVSGNFYTLDVQSVHIVASAIFIYDVCTSDLRVQEVCDIESGGRHEWKTAA
jgi:hypothetical protein